MEKREKIIIILVILAALYGAADYLLFSTKNSAENVSLPEKELINTIVTQVTVLSNAKNSNQDILTKNITQPWSDNIFLMRNPDELKPVEQTDDIPGIENINFNTESFLYSGFLQMADKNIAIINGLDYQEGDLIEDFTLEKITPENITLSKEGFTFNVFADKLFTD